MSETAEHARTTRCKKGWDNCIYCVAGTPHCMCGWVPENLVLTGKQWVAEIDRHIADPEGTNQ